MNSFSTLSLLPTLSPTFVTSLSPALPQARFGLGALTAAGAALTAALRSRWRPIELVEELDEHLLRDIGLTPRRARAAPMLPM